MKNKKYIYIMILLVAVLIAAFASSYAFFSINAEDTVVGNYEVVFNEKLRFFVTGTQSDNIIVSDFDMFGTGEEKVVVNNSHNVTINLQYLDGNEAMRCTFDYVWRWDTTKDGYKKSAGAIYEYVVSGPFEEVNVPDYDASSFVLGSGSISLQNGQTTNTKQVSITTKFYNLADIDQNGHANKTYKGGVIIDNISCEEDSIALNLSNIESEMADIGKEFDMSSAVNLIKTKVSNLNDVPISSFKSTFNINQIKDDMVEEYSVGYNSGTKASYFIIKPTNSTNLASIKSVIDKYYSKNNINMVYEEIYGYMIYLAFTGKEDTLIDVEACTLSMFNDLLKVNDNMLKEQFDIDRVDIDEYLIMIPQSTTFSNSYMIVKPTLGKENQIKEKLDAYMVSQEEKWQNYSQDQYELVINRKYEKYGNYLIYIISSNNDLVLQTIKG